MGKVIQSHEVTEQSARTNASAAAGMASLHLLDLPSREICLNYSLRDAHSWDFLVCEGQPGWSATHVIVCFTIMLYVGNFLHAYLFDGFIEIFEAIVLTAFKRYLFFRTSDAQLETLAGSIVGDWLINDLLGTLMALLILRLWRLPSMTEHLKRTDLPRSVRYKWYAWGTIVLSANLLTSVTWEQDCDLYYPRNCANVGLIASIVIQTILIAAGGFGFLATKADKKYVWQPAGVSDFARMSFFGFWLLLVVLVGMQNAQPYIPLWFVPQIGEWSQVWLASLIWIAALLLYHLVFYKKLTATTPKPSSIVEPGNSHKTL